MPKLKRPPNRYAKLQTMIYGAMGTNGVTFSDMEAPDWICRETLVKRVKHPEQLTLYDLRRLAIALDIPAEELRSAIPFR